MGIIKRVTFKKPFWYCAHTNTHAHAYTHIHAYTHTTTTGQAAPEHLPSSYACCHRHTRPGQNPRSAVLLSQSYEGGRRKSTKRTPARARKHPLTTCFDPALLLSLHPSPLFFEGPFKYDARDPQKIKFIPLRAPKLNDKVAAPDRNTGCSLLNASKASFLLFSQTCPHTYTHAHAHAHSLLL